MSQQWIGIEKSRLVLVSDGLSCSLGDEVHVRQISSQNDCIYRHKVTQRIKKIKEINPELLNRMIARGLAFLTSTNTYTRRRKSVFTIY